MPFKILIVDDSRLIREAVREILERHIPQVIVCGQASDGKEALDILDSCSPELIILDVEMPVMNGITFLTELKKRHKHIPVIMLSALTQQGAYTTFQALELGALEFVPKPDPKSGLKLSEVEDLLVSKVRGVLQMKRNIEFYPREYGSSSVITLEQLLADQPTPLKRTRQLLEAEKPHSAEKKSIEDHLSYYVHNIPVQNPLSPVKSDSLIKRDHLHHTKGNIEIIFIGASTGGPQVITEILSGLPADIPVPIIIVQHMPPIFTAAFANRLDHKSALQVSEAEDGMILEKGKVYIAPGNRHLLIEQRGSRFSIVLNDDPPVYSHRPSVDKTAASIAEHFKGNVLAVILTGMGWDGAWGMRQLYDAGAVTIAQDEQSSVVYGMNRRAVESGVIHKLSSVKNMVDTIMSFF
jgi:two-component system, chemotaxis family, protein-glutamate methylesterase/glutaminase